METNLCEPLLDGSVLPPTVLADASAAAAVSDATPAPFEWRVADDLIERRTYGYRCPKHDPNPEDEISVDSLLGLTYREYEKRREYCALIVYFFGIVMLCFICFANRVDFIALRSNYFVQQSILQLADFKDFNGIESYTDYYDWLEKAMANTFAITPGNRSTPIGFALIRQLRIETDSSCQDSTIKKFGFLGSARCVQQSNRLTLPFPSKGIVLDPQSPFVASASNFTSAYDLDESTYKTYTYQWVSNQVNPDPVNAAPVSGIFTGLSASEYQYEVRLPYYSIDPTVNRSAQAQSVIRTMRLNGFFDVNTAAIGVDMLFFHPTLTRYSMVTFMVEQLPSGLLYPTYTGSTYKLVKMGGSVANLTFAADIFVFLFLIFQIVELAHRIKQRYGILGNLFTASMSNQHVLSAASIGCFIAVMVYRVQLWIIFESLNFSPAPASELTYPKVAPAQGEMMRKMSSAAAVGETSYQWFAVALIPMALKVLLYFKDVKGFNVIHKTLLHGRRDLLTVFCVVFAGIAFFALSGNVFFGGVDSTFLTATVSFATLVRELVSADPGLVTNLVNLEPRVGSLYFSLFFVSMWLVLLNFVLGIIVSGVTTAVAEMNDVSTATSESVKDVFKKYYALRTTEFKSHRPPSRAAFLAQTALVPVLPSPWKRIRMAFEFQTTLYLVVKRVKEFGDETPTIKRKKAETEVLKNLDIIDPKMKSRLFDAALEDVSAQVAATSAMERGAVELWKTIDACYNAALALEGRPADLDDDATTREMAQRLWGSQNAGSSHVSTYGASIYAMTSGVGGSSSVMNQSSMNRSVDGLPRPPRFNLKHNRRRGI